MATHESNDFRLQGKIPEQVFPNSSPLNTINDALNYRSSHLPVEKQASIALAFDRAVSVLIPSVNSGAGYRFDTIRQRIKDRVFGVEQKRDSKCGPYAKTGAKAIIYGFVMISSYN